MAIDMAAVRARFHRPSPKKQNSARDTVQVRRGTGTHVAHEGDCLQLVVLPLPSARGSTVTLAAGASLDTNASLPWLDGSNVPALHNEDET